MALDGDAESAWDEGKVPVVDKGTERDSVVLAKMDTGMGKDKDNVYSFSLAY